MLPTAQPVLVAQSLRSLEWCRDACSADGVGFGGVVCGVDDAVDFDGPVLGVGYVDELLCVRARDEVGFRRESRAARETVYNVDILVREGDDIEVVVGGACA